MALIHGGGDRSVHPCAGAPREPDLLVPLFLPLQHFPWVAFLPSGGQRSLSPRGWGAQGSHQWQWLPSRLGSRWEKRASSKMRWHRVFLSQRGREGVGSSRNLLAGEGAIGGSPAHSLLPGCSKGKVPSGIWLRTRSCLEIAIHFSRPWRAA